MVRVYFHEEAQCPAEDWSGQRCELYMGHDGDHLRHVGGNGSLSWVEDQRTWVPADGQLPT